MYLSFIFKNICGTVIGKAYMAKCQQLLNFDHIYMHIHYTLNLKMRIT